MSAPHGPKLHASQFCDALRTWARLVSEPKPGEDEDAKRERQQFAAAWGTVELAITKSCLLDRLIYCGDVVRTEPCPVHKGHWSGISATPCQYCGVSPCGCNTGWVPAKFDAAKANQSVLDLVANEPPPKTE